MPLYIYQKAPLVPRSLDEVGPPKRPIFYFLPLLISFLGLSLISFVVWPVLSYELGSRTTAYRTSSGLLNPLVESSATALAVAPSIVDQLDYTDANNWFPTATVNLLTSPTTTYSLSIPKLKIDTALVRTDSLDLGQSLVHYPGTALPGQPGNSVIFGHSILPQFYNPKNYLSIFSLLPTLETGDLIQITYDQVTYTYQISSRKEVYPQDLTPLQQNYSTRQLKLITCVPPGLKTRRLVVTADLVKS